MQRNKQKPSLCKKEGRKEREEEGKRRCMKKRMVGKGRQEGRRKE